MNLTAIDAEQRLLGAVLLKPALMLDLVRQLDAGDFADPHHRAIWRAVAPMAGREFDAVEVKHALDQAGHLTDRMREKLVAIESEAISTASAEQHAGIVARLAVRRRLRDAAERVARLATEHADDATLMGEAEAAVLSAGRLARSSEPRSMREALMRYMAEQDKARTESGLYGVPTGIPKFDRIYRGLRPGRVYVIAARPGMGKSTLALQWAIHAARKGVRVLAFSLEMRAEELAPRALSHDLRTPEDEALDRLTHDERFMRDYQAAAESVAGLSIDIDDGISNTLPEIRAQARRHQVRHPDLGCIVVDYLQLIHAGRKRSESREAELAEVSRGMKSLSLHLGLPIVLLAQLNRDAEKEKRAPRMSDLRGSGAIEQDADLVMFIHAKDSNADPEGPGSARDVELIVDKARMGPIGTIDATFFTAWAQFREVAQQDPTGERHP